MERQYAPYPKWFGSAFRQLPCAGELSPVLWRALQAATWQAREEALCEAYEWLARRHNRLAITEPLPETVSPYYSRPFRVIHGDRFADAILRADRRPGRAADCGARPDREHRPVQRQHRRAVVWLLAPLAENRSIPARAQ